MCISIGVGLYYTPYLVNNLGIIQYGILPLALVVNQYISVVTGILTHSYTRFYSVALREDNLLEASKNISTSFVVVLFLIALIVLVGFPLVQNVEDLFSIPREFITEARLLFVFTLGSFCVSLFSSLLNVTLYALNRLDLMNILKILRSVANFGIVILLFNLYNTKVSFVGLSGLISEVIVLLLSILFFYKFKPKKVIISARYFDKVALSAIVTMSIWILIQQCGDTLLYRTDNLIVNHFFGLKYSGALGAISELCGYTRMAVNVVGSLFGPLILIAYSKGQHDEVQNLAYGQSFIVGSLSAIIAGLLSGYGESVLRTWLGNGLEAYSLWLFLKMIVVPFYASGGILAFVYRAWNKVKTPAIWTIIIGVVDVVLTILFLHLYKGHFRIEIMLLICTLFSIAQCYILNVYCVNGLYPGNRQKAIGGGIRILTVFIMSFIIGHCVDNLVKIDSLAMVALFLFVSGLLILGIVYFLFFSKKERSLLFNIIK